MVKAFLITGQTYMHRREIQAAGGKWNREHAGWLVPSDRIEQLDRLIGEQGFDVDEIEVEPEDLERPTGEKLRAVRQEKLEAKVARLRERAETREKQATGLAKQLAVYDDPAFWTEPVKAGHHSAGRHRRLREKLSGKMDRRWELLAEADRLRRKAEWLESQGARVAGDAERKRQSQRERNDELLEVGDRVSDFAFGKGTIVRKNKKSYTIGFDSGGQYRRDKSHVRAA